MADDEKKPPPSLTVTPSTAEVFTGETVQLTASNPQASWSSSNTAVAVVGASGLVTGVAPGDAAIKAQVKGEKGEMRITVRNREDPDNIIPPPVEASGYGPQATQTQPAGATVINVGDNIPAIVSAAANGTVFWIRAGVHSPSGPIFMKPSQQIVGEYGAILDGSSIAAPTSGTAIVSGWNATAPNVVVQNLVIRNLLSDGKGIGWFGPNVGGWIIRCCEISGCSYGLGFGTSDTGQDVVSGSNLLAGPQIIRCSIHHNVVAGYSGQQTINTSFDTCEVWNNGNQQKILRSKDSVWSDCWLHHNDGAGVWFDGDNYSYLVEGCLSEDNGAQGYMFEVSGGGILRNSIARRNAVDGVFISTSQDVEVYGCTFEDNLYNINLFISCIAIAETPYAGMIDRDCKNNNIHDNIIRIGAATYGAAVSAYDTCSERTTFLAGASNNVFSNNAYYAPTTTDSWFLWEPSFRSFTQWQGLGVDTNSTIAVRT